MTPEIQISFGLVIEAFIQFNAHNNNALKKQNEILEDITKHNDKENILDVLPTRS